MLNIALIVISILAIVGSILPISKSKHWFIRGQSNFRAVYLFLNLLLLLLIVISSLGILFKIVLGIMLALAIFICMRSIAPYSPLYPKKVDDAKIYNDRQELSILIHNVYQYNDQYKDLSSMILDQDPDVVLLLETNVEWDYGMTALYDKYDHVVKKIQENTYGIILMSKLELSVGEVNHLVSKKIPSVEALFLKNGKEIRIIGLHPEPPIPGEVLTSVPKEKEMLATADKIDKLNDDELTIVVGDLNDVAWSRVSKKFKNITGLVDPRVGRGFYSTFPAYSPLKIPLDHVFCSEEFELIQFETLEAMGSDHKAVFVKFKIPD